MSVTTHSDTGDDTARERSLINLFEMLNDDSRLKPFFETIYQHEDAFCDGTIIEDDSINAEVSYYGTDITFAMLDAIVFGIYWEQQSPSYNRDPDTEHFASPRGLESLEEVRDAQPDPEFTAFFDAHIEYIESGETGEISPPEITVNGLNVALALRNAIVFGREWEAWYANGYASNPAYSLYLDE